MDYKLIFKMLKGKPKLEDIKFIPDVELKPLNEIQNFWKGKKENQNGKEKKKN